MIAALCLIIILLENEVFLLFLQSYFKGAVAQLVEQRTENPCVGGSIPPHTTRAYNKTLTVIDFKNFIFSVCDGKCVGFSIKYSV